MHILSDGYTLLVIQKAVFDLGLCNVCGRLHKANRVSQP